MGKMSLFQNRPGQLVFVFIAEERYVATVVHPYTYSPKLLCDKISAM